jgi:hypothetical protein
MTTMKTKLILSVLFFLLSTNLQAKPYLDLKAPFDFDVSKLACDDGNAKECVLLSFKYLKGTDELVRNYSKAKIYADKACKLGDKNGCMILMNVDEEKDRDLLNQSCKDGNDTACIALQVLKNKKYYIVDGKCSKCGSTHIGRYLYGLVHPDKKLNAKIDKGEVVLGGCMISEDSPKHFCRNCGANLHEQKIKHKTNVE